MGKTSAFGTIERESHDSSEFYARFESPEISLSTVVNDIPLTNVIYQSSSEDMGAIPTDSVSLMVTSPPYHCGKDYDINLSFDEYLSEMERVLAETHRVLQPGGRAAINVANLGRKPYIPLTSHFDSLCQDLGFLPRGQIIWIKGEGTGSCAFGTYMSAGNPVLRDLHEYILIYSKGRFDRVVKGESTTTKEEFLQSTVSVWKIPPASAKRIGHPAPFPVEIPKRLINLYTFKEEVILDPFMGSGSTAMAAVQSNRRYIGYETDPAYVDLAAERVQKEHDLANRLRFQFAG